MRTETDSSQKTDQKPSATYSSENVRPVFDIQNIVDCSIKRANGEAKKIVALAEGDFRKKLGELFSDFLQKKHLLSPEEIERFLSECAHWIGVARASSPKNSSSEKASVPTLFDIVKKLINLS